MHSYSGSSKSSCSVSGGEASVFSQISSQLLQKSPQLTPLRRQVHLCVSQPPEICFLCKFLKMENFKIYFIYQYVQDLFYYFPVVSQSSPTPHTKCIPLLMSLEVPPPTFTQITYKVVQDILKSQGYLIISRRQCLCTNSNM